MMHGNTKLKFINKPLLLHLVGVYVIYINDARSSKYQITLLFLVAIIVNTCIHPAGKLKGFQCGCRWCK